MLSLEDIFLPLQFLTPWDNHSYSHATSVMFTTPTTSTERFKLEISVNSKCSSQETVISQLKFSHSHFISVNFPGCGSSNSLGQMCQGLMITFNKASCCVPIETLPQRGAN